MDWPTHPIGKERHRAPLLKQTAGLVIVYVLMGKASLLLATPPGHGTAIFLPAGIAAAVLLIWGHRRWPGVFLGSALLNIWVLGSTEGSITLELWAVTLALALGSTLQAWVAAALVRRFVGFPTPLAHELDIVRFSVLSGPIACLIATSVGTTTLWAAGLLDSAVLLIWGTWWVGDTLGVIIVTPLIFCFAADPGPIWRGRRLSVALPLTVLAVLVVALFARVREWERTHLQLRFQNHADHLVHALEVNFNGYLQHIKAIERLFTSSDHVTRAEFNQFTFDALRDHSGIHALEWVPRVSDAERQAFEQRARRDGLAEFSIREQRAPGVMVTAGRRDDYFPAYYLEPLAGNEKAMGFDLASSPDRKRALERSRDRGEMVATARMTLVQDSQHQFGFLVLHPIYADRSIPDTVEARRARLMGFAVGVFRIREMVEAGLNGLDRTHVRIELFDSAAPVQPHALLSAVEKRPIRAHPGLEWSFPFDMAGRPWVFHFSGNRAYAAQHSLGYPWLVMFGSLTVSVMAAVFLLGLTGRAARVEDQVKQRTAELQDSESRMKAIVESAVEAIITTSDRGIIESVNVAATRLFGYTDAEMIGRNVAMLMTTPHREQHDLYLERYRRTGIARIIGISREVEGLRKDGSLVPLQLSLSDVTLADRKIFTGILHDLTERKRADRLKNDFVSTVSHELRTPLTSIQGSLGLIKGGVAGLLPARALSLVEVAHRNGERLVRLINDILDLEKIEAGKMDFTLEVQTISPLIRQALDTNRSYAEKHEVRLALTDDLADARAAVDIDRFAQVMANLLSNAAKISPHDAQVEISLTRHDGWLRVAVRDHGEGIPEGFRGKIFQKFSQVDSGNTRQTGGTGLGLSICKVIVERMGGTIGFKTDTGVGTTFCVALPEVGRPHTLEGLRSEPTAPPEARILLCGARSSATRILYVEDDASLVEVVKSLLEQTGTVDGAFTLHEARQRIDHCADHYDLILLDIELPDGSGLELLPMVRQRCPRVPIVIFSGDDVTSKTAREVDAALVKSRTSTDTLLETIEQLIDKGDHPGSTPVAAMAP